MHASRRGLGLAAALLAAATAAGGCGSATPTAASPELEGEASADEVEAAEATAPDSPSTPTRPDASCGDGTCSSSETAESCPRDCREGCGDQVCTDGETAASCYVDCTAETFTFPLPGDDFHGEDSGPQTYFWRLHQYVEGRRSSRLHVVTRAEINLIFDDNGLTCDTQDVQVLVNGAVVGTFSISGSDRSVQQTFSFQPIAGPDYVVRYITTREVAAGCGAASYSRSGDSKLTLAGP